MYTYEMWDKISPINTVNATDFLEDTPSLKFGEVFVVKSGEKIQYVESVDTIRSVMGLPSNMASDKVANAYTSNLNQGLLMEPENVKKLKEQEDKIDILEAEKEALKKVTKEQDDLLVENAFKIAEIQMKLGGM